ncbi:MAG: class I SAM-dependent methyltransferase [Rhodothermales bacterium]|nr:class I SAM-dependent methyltransferase [Rhodothermales bacterium]
MTKRIRRHPDFEVIVNITNDDFIKPPRVDQRNWILNAAMREFAGNLEHLDRLASTFIAGSPEPVDLSIDRTNQPLTASEIMEDWQIPIMQEMASYVTDRHGDVLEVGFGRGIASSFIQERGVASHTIVECNEHVASGFDDWRTAGSVTNARLILGKWQDVHDQFEMYDGILFHAYPLNAEEYSSMVVNSSTFAEHFFEVAAAHLKPGGVFTYLTHEYDSLSREHQRVLFGHFESITLTIMDQLHVPDDSRDSMWADSIVLIKAVQS